MHSRLVGFLDKKSSLKDLRDETWTCPSCPDIELIWFEGLFLNLSLILGH